MSITFNVAELKREIESIGQIAGPFLALRARSQLQQVAADLDGIARGTGPRRWAIPLDSPIQTRLSKGEYQRGGGQHSVFGAFTFVWEIEPSRTQGDTRPADEVTLVGLASSCLRIIEGDPVRPGTQTELAMWRMEVGDANSPGTHFHVQVLGHGELPPFPSSLDVPRLPGMLVSPFACLEFLVSELFQEDWVKEVNRDTGPLRQWRGVQRSRIRAQLEWQLGEIEAVHGSPWSALKAAKPPRELFAN